MKIKELRMQKGYRQQDIAKMLDMSIHTYRSKEKGRRGFKVKELLRLEKIFQVSISKMFED